MTDRKKPAAAFWLTVVLVAVLVAYPLSFGPVIWLESRGWLEHLPVWAQSTIGPLYWPIVSIAADGPEPIADVIRWYCDIWV